MHGSPFRKWFMSFPTRFDLERFLQRLFHGTGAEAVRAGGTLEGDAAVLVDDVKAVGPGGVGAVGGVVEGVDQGGERDFEVADAGGGDRESLCVGFGVGVDDAVALIDRKLPDVARVGFLDIDDIERYAVLVFLVDLVENGNLPPERRSSIGAKDEHNRAVSQVGGELDAPGAILAGEIEIGGGVAGAEISTTGPSP